MSSSGAAYTVGFTISILILSGKTAQLFHPCLNWTNQPRLPTVRTMRHFKHALIMFWLFGSTCAPQALASPSSQSAELLGKDIKIHAQITGGRLEERYFARADKTWIELATAGTKSPSNPVCLTPGAADLPTPSPTRISTAHGSLLEEIQVGPHRVLRKLTVQGEWIHVTTTLRPSNQLQLREFSDHLNFSHKTDWSYSPSVGGFNPDAQYKAPLILVQSGPIAFGIVPDLLSLGRVELTRCNHVLTLDVPGGPELITGYLPARLASHSIYALDTNRIWIADAPLTNSYFLLVTARAKPQEAYREAVRFHWEHFGRQEQIHAANQQTGTDQRYRSLSLWDDWREMVWNRESPELWLTVPLSDNVTGGSVRTWRWGPGPSIYLSSWFNSLRTSYGMALYAQRTSRPDLLDLATQTAQVALKAPGVDGAFKCIAVPGTNNTPTLWAAGDGSGGSTRDGFLGYDMCWTAYWLLKWRAAGLPSSDAILSRCRGLAEFMMHRQMPDGMLPTRFAEDGSVQEQTSTAVKAETGPVALFLLELYAQDPNPSYLRAARRGLEFLQNNVIPLRQWYDYETFWSCSPRKALFDPKTQQWPANNLALSQTVEAFLLAYRLTGQSSYLAQGEALLDYLLLFQQCWTNPRLQNLSSSAMLLGGFTTQNSDAEWSDARQSQCGNVLLDYYRATGKAEYLERGIAALRAQFPVSPSENWAHVGYGPKAGVSSFHWGTGSGMAGIEIEDDYLRDAVVDVAASRGVGVNGLNLTQCSVSGGKIRLSMSSPFQWKRPPVVVFHRTDPEGRYVIVANGVKLGSWLGKQLEKGISVPVPSARGF